MSMKGEPDQMPVDTAVDMICWPTFDGPLSEPSVGYFVCFLTPACSTSWRLVFPFVVVLLRFDDFLD